MLGSWRKDGKWEVGYDSRVQGRGLVRELTLNEVSETCMMVISEREENEWPSLEQQDREQPGR